MNPLAPFFAYIARKRAARAMRQAEHRRQAIIAQQSRRKAEHKRFRYLDGDLIQATNQSLRASVGWREVR